MSRTSFVKPLALCSLFAIAACSGVNSAETVAGDAGAVDAKIAPGDANASSTGPRTGLQYSGAINLVRSAK